MEVKDYLLYLGNIYKDNNFPQAKIWGLKKGSYKKYYQEIKNLFPRSKFLGIIRDGRAVFNSQKYSIQSRTGKPFETDPLKAARSWSENLQILKEIKQNYSQDMLVIYYEDIVKEKERVLKEICKFLRVDYYTQAKENQGYFVSERYGKLHENIKKDSLKDRISAWQDSLSSEEIRLFESVAYNDLIAEGYTLVNNLENFKSA
jgi:hypothetical protein